MKTVGERLAWARREAGYETAAAAARALALPYPTYQAHENASRGIKPAAAERYSRFFRVSLEWLLTGRGEAGKELASAGGYDKERMREAIEVVLDGLTEYHLNLTPAECATIILHTYDEAAAGERPGHAAAVAENIIKFEARRRR